MKILILITKGEIGGAQVYVANLAEQLKINGHEITVGVGAGHNDFLAKQCEKHGITLKIFKNLVRSFNVHKSILFCSEFHRYLRINDFDAVILNSSNTLPAALVAKRAHHKPKVIFVFHGLSFLDPSCKNILKRWLTLLPFKLFLPYVDEKVFVSKTNQSYAQKIKLVDKSTVIYPGVRKDFKSKDESVKFLSKNLNANLNGKTIVGSIGRLAYPKNYEFLIGTFRALNKEKPNIIGIIIGDGPERKKYANLIKKNRLEKCFFLTGAIEDAGKYIKAFDVFVLPSIYEGFSLTLLEALAAGVPVLASRVGGNPEAVGYDEGQLFKVDDEKEFIEKLDRLLKDHEVTHNNKKRAEGFSWAVSAKQYSNLLMTPIDTQ
jgi:glycosyltransferase involved in cell wall biosynthesis